MNTPWILGIDASTPRCTIVLGRIDEDGSSSELVAHDDEFDRANQASTRLTQRIARVLEGAGLTAAELGLVGCSRGPGTFTGTRVALSTAKGIALGVGCELLPVSTLAALALSASFPAVETLVLPALDARRNEVYATLFRVTPGGTLTTVVDEQVAPLSSIVSHIEAQGLQPDVIIGPGARAYATQLPDAWPAYDDMVGPSPQGLWRALVVAAYAQQACDPAQVDAVYLRKSYAELGIHRPKRPFVKSPFV